MFKKIILTFVLLISAHQEFYAMQSNNSSEDSSKKWKTISNWVSTDITKEDKKYPKLWWLWAITDNVPIQYGNSKIWKHGEAYYGLSNGIGFFPSISNFGWLKIGIGDAHINVISLILDYFKCFVNCKVDNKSNKIFLFLPIFVYCCFNIHILSVKILNCIKIKLVTPLMVLVSNSTNIIDKTGNSTAWYINFDDAYKISWWYALLSPRIEINISEIINYLKKK